MDANEEIKKADIQRQKDRRQLLLEAVKKEFSGADIFIPPDDPRRIRSPRRVVRGDLSAER